jgi:hypothetical protein
LLFGSTILVVVPVGGDQHAGFIVNRPRADESPTVC